MAGLNREHQLRTKVRGALDGGAWDSYRPEIHSLFSCPPFGAGNFALVQRDGEGHVRLLLLGRAPFAAPTLNLALARRFGAELGANEVHIWAGRAFESD